MARKPVSIQRVQRRWGAVVLLLLLAVFGALGARLTYINTVLRPKLLQQAQRQQHGATAIPARRGMIFDAQGRVLAASRQQPDVFIDPARVEDIDALAAQLGPLLNIPAAQIVEQVRQRPESRFIVVARGVEAVDAEAVEALRHPGVGLAERSARTYPLGSSAVHVLGFVGADGHGLEGIELTLDEHLSGRDGRRATIRDARRRPLWRAEEGSSPPVDGGHIVLTIDAEIQRLTEEQLDQTARKYSAESGVAIVVSPKTGAVLALASWPEFDPHHPQAVPPEHRRNRALTDPTEAGSTFKSFVVSGALAGGFVSTTEEINCHWGTYHVGRRLITDVHGYGKMTVQGIICKSSNIGMVQIAQRMTREALYNTIRGFGFGEATGIELPGEAPGQVYPLSKWTSYSATSLAMGYEVSVTPLQLVMAYAALANDGVLLRPRLVRALLGPDGRVVQSFDTPEVAGQAIPREWARYVCRELLAGVVTPEGSGRQAQIPGYRVLGKTGTAKLPYPNHRGYEPGAYLSSFVGAAPVSDPEAVVLMMVRKPRASEAYYGGTVAAPAVGEVLKGVLAYLEIPPDKAEALALAK
ncbi:MAG TPA: penicillin-binding protein 2 [Phycisphaerae bacterium]|nr:penicillin-binding protein 2 [Phycisphaerae bacterium]HNU45582.1 penicillin-binding protein 2 [Phycisphaerae bacterium]